MNRWEKHFFANGKINVSFLEGRPKTSSLILFIPGGPGLSSHYLDDFILKLSTETDLELALLDLPNHDQSFVFSESAIDFHICSQLISDAINDLSKRYAKIHLFCHSLGGVFILNKLDSINVETIFFCSVPAKLDHSSEFKEKQSEIIFSNNHEDEELDFRDRFNLLSPLYYNSLSNFDLKANWLKTSFWRAGKYLMKGFFNPPRCSGKREVEANNNMVINIIEGSRDIVLIEQNCELLKRQVPNSIFHSVDQSGHFPFIENPDRVISIILARIS